MLLAGDDKKLIVIVIVDLLSKYSRRFEIFKTETMVTIIKKQRSRGVLFFLVGCASFRISHDNILRYLRTAALLNTSCLTIPRKIVNSLVNS